MYAANSLVEITTRTLQGTLLCRDRGHL